jgi:endonuclease YncB( thermonuclease family)
MYRFVFLTAVIAWCSACTAPVKPEQPSPKVIIPLRTTVNARVIDVSDGDSLTLLLANGTQVKIRLSCIDAPELLQDFGERAKHDLSERVLQKLVKFRSESIDRYGITLGYVFLGTTNVNLEQVKAGFAWENRHFCHDPAFVNAQYYSKSAGLALWSQKNPTPPWDFRKGK